jgi:hypothetical protein
VKALALTPDALFRLAACSISEEWFKEFATPAQNISIKRAVVNDIVYLIDPDLNTDDVPIIVIRVDGKDGVFSDKNSRITTLERIITVGRWIYSEGVSVPTTWRKHHEGSLFSIQATARNPGWRARVHFDRSPKGSRDLFAFSRTDDTVNFDKLDAHVETYLAAKAGLAQAVLSSHEPLKASQSGGITLSQRLPQGFVQGATLEQWYENKLTAEQRSFVDKPTEGPVRLRGAAGTGKTLSLVVKFLRDAIIAEGEQRPMKVGFLAHSFASVDLITSISESLDRTGLIYGAGRHVKLEVKTLYDLAHKNLNFELDELQPLSLDGREGRRLQAELIETALRDLAGSGIASAQFQDMSEDIHERWREAVARNSTRLVHELMNEFASVLDAEGVRAGEERGERYAKGTASRPTWLMSLPTELDRRFVLEVHRRYRKFLGEMNTLSVDQMIGDFNSFLDSNRWDRIRSREGFDVLFVDELHLFTSIERQTLHKLIKQSTEEDGRPRRPPIFMAYDLKQSPRDAFATYLDGDTNLFSASTGLQGSELVKLDRVFRYTPQIAEFLADLDATFPAINVSDEWEAYSGRAEGDGVKPELTVYPDEVSLFRTVFNEALSVARSIEGGGRRVAVLCVSEEQFDKYVTAAGGQFLGKHIAITSREPSSELRHAGKRFVFSMPEYVAGLQFDTVFLVHVDAIEAPTGAQDGVRRRFISNVYLGSSRAEKTLKVSSCLARGGKSDILDMSLERMSLIERRPVQKTTSR